MRTISCENLELSLNKKAPQTAGYNKQRGLLLIFAFNHFIPKPLYVLSCLEIPYSIKPLQNYIKLQCCKNAALKADYTSRRNQQSNPGNVFM